MKITQFTIEEVRCFAERQTFEIRPLTFLVGENSTGKTTALACFQVLADFIDKGEVNFNPRSYSMGTFGDIVRRSRKSDKSFLLGFSIDVDGEMLISQPSSSKKQMESNLSLEQLLVGFEDGDVRFEIRQAAQRERESALRKAKTYTFNVPYRSVPSGAFRPFFPCWEVLRREAKRDLGRRTGSLGRFLREKYDNNSSLFRLGVSGNLTALSTAPVRSEPKTHLRSR